MTVQIFPLNRNIEFWFSRIFLKIFFLSSQIGSSRPIYSFVRQFFSNWWTNLHQNDQKAQKEVDLQRRFDTVPLCSSSSNWQTHNCVIFGCLLWNSNVIPSGFFFLLQTLLCPSIELNSFHTMASKLDFSYVLYLPFSKYKKQRQNEKKKERKFERIRQPNIIRKKKWCAKAERPRSKGKPLIYWHE